MVQKPVNVPDSTVSTGRRRLLNVMSLGIVTPVTIMAVVFYLLERPETNNWGIRLHGTTAALALLAIGLTLVMQGIRFYGHRDSE